MNPAADTVLPRAPRPGRERLVTTLIFALLAHGIVILGVGFVALAPDLRPGTAVNIVLVNGERTPTPARTSALAEHDQRGPGNSHRRLPIRSASENTPFPKTGSLLADRLAAALGNPMDSIFATPRSPTRDSIVTTWNRSTPVARLRSQPEGERPALAVRLAASARGLAATGLKLPRLYGPHPEAGAHTVNARAALYATYLLAWQRRIERVGTAQFARLVPAGIRGGHLTVGVTLARDGDIRSVSILKRSAQPLLDAAALKIIRLAAPFAPFPPKLAAHTDTLSFSYRWNFIRTASGAGSLGLGGD